MISTPGVIRWLRSLFASAPKPAPKPAPKLEYEYDEDALTISEMVNLQQAASEMARKVRKEKARAEAAQRQQPPDQRVP